MVRADESISNNDKVVPKKIAVVLEHHVANSRYGWWCSNRALNEKKDTSITFFHSADGGNLHWTVWITTEIVSAHLMFFSASKKAPPIVKLLSKWEPQVVHVTSEKWLPLMIDPVWMVSNSNTGYVASVSPARFVMAHILNILTIFPNQEDG